MEKQMTCCTCGKKFPQPKNYTAYKCKDCNRVYNRERYALNQKKRLEGLYQKEQKYYGTE